MCSEVSRRSTVEGIDEDTIVLDGNVEITVVVVVDNLEDAEGVTVRITM
jgi:hypothetical protein